MNKKDYINFLKKNVFKIDEYNQFNLMFDDFKNFNKLNYKHCAILERNYMYNNKSIFAPLLDKKHKLTSIDFRIDQSHKRIGIQNNFIKNINYKFIESEFYIQDLENKYSSNIKKLDNDLLLIPNSLHHISNLNLLMKKISILMPKLKYIYIFDSYLRESHQAPNDYCRYTTFALETLMKLYNYKSIKINETGNIFDAIMYLFSQSKNLLENKELKKIKLIYENELMNELKKERIKKKWVLLGRKYAKMNTAYSIIFKKNA
jgi:hypothetical protein